MNATVRIGTLTVAVAAALALATSTTAASTTIGQSEIGGFVCGSPNTYVQSATGGAPAYAAPADGVITSWGTGANGNGGQTLALKVMRRDPANPAKYFTLARDIDRPLVVSSLNTFPNATSPDPVRIPIAAGDLLGDTGSASASCSFLAGSVSDQVSSVGADTAVDPTTSTLFGAPTASRRLDIAAVIEPDADKDGFGDETQDLCPTSAATQAACPPTATGLRAAALKKCKKKRSKKKRKKCRKRARKLPVYRLTRGSPSRA
jgi:hypothetical protein